MTRRPDEPDLNAHTLRPVLKGEPYSRAVDGGVRRTPAPADGLVVVLADREVFLERAEAQGTLDQLVARAYDALLAPVGRGRQ
jgi:hypothetical protein